MTDIQILSAIKNNGGSMDFVSVLNLNITDNNRDALADKSRIEKMINDKLLEGKTNAHCQIVITDAGRQFLQDQYYLEEQRQKDAQEAAKDKADQKRRNRFLCATTIISLVIAALAVAIAFVELIMK